jgi:uncharacterized cupin superfamily protein/catechol 2,3-dioxygenase-like lactoylglutathione lyase family enzyme
MIEGVHHVQLTIPKAAEAQARAFYCDLLGLKEIVKPSSLQGRGGFWLQLPGMQIHVGTEDAFDRSKTKAHVGYKVHDLVALRSKLEAQGFEVLEGPKIPGIDRFESRDPFGNRIEFVQLTERSAPEDRPCNIKHFSEIQDSEAGRYPGSDEPLSIGSPFAKRLGLSRLGIHHELLPPGQRTSWPHAEQDEEEFIYVIEGTPDVWIDGHLHPLRPGDGVAFPCGTGSCHTFINNSENDVRLLVVGEASKKGSKIYYPLNPERREQVKANWWHDVPQRPQGAHDGLPDRIRKS